MDKNQYYLHFSRKVSNLFIFPIGAQCVEIWNRGASTTAVRNIRAFKWLTFATALLGGYIEQIEYDKKMTSCDRFYNEVQQQQKAWFDGLLSSLQFEKVKLALQNQVMWKSLKPDSDHDKFKEDLYMTTQDRQDFLRFYYKNYDSYGNPIDKYNDVEVPTVNALDGWTPPEETNVQEHNFTLNPK